METKAGKQAKERPERTDSLVDDYLKKKKDGTYRYSVGLDLVVKYGISSARIFQLLKKRGVKRK